MTKSNVHDKPTTSEANFKRSSNLKSAKGISWETKVILFDKHEHL